MKTTVVEGDGVVGQTPVLEPGEDFSYNSYHVTAANAGDERRFFWHHRCWRKSQGQDARL